MASNNSPRTAAKPQSVATPNRAVSPLDTLEAPIIAPEFIDSLNLEAGQVLYDYLNEYGPVEVFDLYRVMGSLECFNEDVERHAGQVTRDTNSSILKSVTEAVNAIATMGGQFTDGFTCSIRRTPQLTTPEKARKNKGGAR